MNFDLTRRLTAEALGTFILVMAVVGSGIMAAKLAGGNQAIALLCNTLATGAVLFVIITIFAPISGAHFNPAVSLMMLRGELDRPTTLAYIAVQIVGGCLGAVAAHLMFGLDLLQFGSTARTGLGQWVGEALARNSAGFRRIVWSGPAHLTLVAGTAGLANSQANKTAAANAPRSSATMKPGTSPGAIPANVSLKLRAMVTAGLAKEVEAVNQ